MEARAATPPSASPEDRSDGNEPLSAPSEFLAEFLSAIMRRQYAEALKYCRLILQYEPHNATARGFYPLLRHKLRRAATPHEPPYHHDVAESEPASSSEASEASEADAAAELMEQAADSGAEWAGGSASSQSSLELDSEPASRSDATDDTDTNGNLPPPPPRYALAQEDVENENASGASSSPRPPAPASAHPHQSVPAATATLQRLRAHFACSIK